MFGNQTLLLSNCLFSSDQYAIRVQGPEYEFEIVWGSQVYFLLRLSYFLPKARFKLEILQGGTSFVGLLCFCSVLCLLKVSNGAKIRNRYNQVPHLTQDTNGKVTNSQKTPQTRAKRSVLSQQVTTKHI